MAKQLNVNLAFNADVTNAKAALSSLGKDLQKIQGIPSKVFDDTDIKNASKAAQELQRHLQAAVDVNTGKLDLNRFSVSMKQAGHDLEYFRDNLSKVGPVGQQTFLNLAKSIALSEAPATRVNARLNEMMTTLKNTTRWQISSSIVHGFMGTIQSAYGYAKDLNESLNNIRIVTGQTTEQMADFAKEANKAAQALSTTTTTYTDAALIFYQQGLGDSEVKERTEATIKMANVTRDSATEVSSYMTAIWNNFDDGSESLEHYADVITALGAATASSSAEIAGGLEKFAAIGNQIGLSYEYATAALATVVAETRQSEDVVGTAFKTIFARIQGLNLGETLEDGTDLNKYSKALDVIGISIKDTNGEVKDMNVILDEMGAKWGTLTKDVQIATAQTVAGVRQYNQLIALMDNWDTFKNNVSIAEDSDGELEKQAEIYAESWEAARDRVKAAAQEIYSSLLDDEFFIGVSNTFAKILNGVNDVIQGMGGVKGILLLIGSLFMKNFSKEIPAKLKDIAANFSILTGAAQKNAIAMKEQNQAMLESYDVSGNDRVFNARITGMTTLNKLTLELSQNEKYLSEAEKQEYQARIQTIQSVTQSVEEHSKEVQELEKAIEKEKELAAQKAVDTTNKGKQVKQTDYNAQVDGVKKYVNALQGLYKQNSAFLVLQKQMETKGVQFDKYADNIKKAGHSVADLKKQMSDYIAELKKSEKLPESAFGDIDELLRSDCVEVDKLTKAYDKFVTQVNGGPVEKEMDGIARAISAVEAKLQSLGMDNSAIKQLEVDFENGAISAQELDMELQRLSEQADIAGQRVASIPEKMGNFASAAMSVGMALSSIKNLGSIWSDEDASIGDKLIATMTSLSMILPLVSVAEQAYTTILGKEKAEQAATNLLHAIGIGVKTGEAAATEGAAAAQWSLNAAMMANPIGAVIALVVALVAVLGGLAFILYKCATAESAESKAAKRAAESAEQLAEEAEKAREEAEKLRDTFGKYDEAVEALNKCTKGTQEWKDALKEVNEAALEVIENLPDNLSAEEISNLYERDRATGQITLNEDAMNNIQEKADKHALNAEFAAQAGQIVADFAQIKADIRSEVSSKLYDDLGYQISSDLIADNMDKLVGLTADEFKTALDELGVDISYLSDNSLATYQTKIEELSAQTDAAATKMQMIADIQVDNTLGDEYDGATKAMTSNQLQARTDELYKGYLDLYTSNSRDYIDELNRTSTGINKASGANNDIYEEALKDLQAAGYNYDKQKNNAVRGSDSNRSFAFLDEDGKEIIRSAEWVAQTVAASKALEEMEVSAEKAQQALSTLDSAVGEGVASGIKDFITGGDFASMTSADFSTMSSDINDNYDGDISAYLSEKMGMTEQELINAFGENFEEDFQKALELTEDSFSPEELAKGMGIEANGKVYNTAGESLKKLFDSIDYSEMTSGAMKNFANAYEQIFEQGGEEALAIIDSIVEGAGDNADEVAALIANTDWTNWDSIEALKTSCADLGYEIDDNLILELQKANGAVKDFDATQFCEQLASIVKIIGELQTGDTISAEDYAALGEGYEDYFMLMADGTYKLIRDAETFKAAVMSSTTEDLITKMDEIKATRESLLGKQKAATDAMDGYSLDTLQKDQFNKYEDGPKDGYVGWYSGKTVDAQIDFLEQMGYNADQIQAWRDDLANNDTTTDVLTKISEEVQGVTEEYEGYADAIAAADVQLAQAQEAYASTAQTFEELQAMLDAGTIGADAFTKAYIALTDAERMEDLDAKEIDAYADHLGDLVETMDEATLGATKLSKDLKGDKEALKDLSIQVQRMTKGVEQLADNWEDWSSILKKSSKGSEEYFKAAEGTKDALSDLLDISTEFIDLDFVDTLANDEESMELMKKAAEGDGEAIDQLRQKALESIVLNMEISGDLSNEELWTKVQELQSTLDTMPLEVGTKIDLSGVDEGETEFINSLNEMIASAGLTTAQVNAMLSGMGFSATFASEEQTIPAKIPVTTTHHTRNVTTYDEHGNPIEWTDTESANTEYHEAEGEYSAFAMSTGAPGEVSVPKIESITKKANGSANNYSSSNDGGKKPGKGGGDKAKDPKKIDHKTKEDPEVDRYHVITEQLERLNAELDKISKAKDRAFGAKKLKLMDEEIAKQEELIKKNQEYADMLKNNRDSEMEQLKKLGAQFDDKGVITNYNELIKKNQADYSKYNSGVDYYNSLDAEAQENLDKQYQGMTDTDGNYYGGYQDYLQKVFGETADKQQEEFEKLLEQYESDQETYEKIMQEIQDAKDAIFDEKLEKIGYVVDVKLDVDDSDIKYLEFLLTELEDKDFHAAEAIANIGLQTGKSLDKIKQYEKGIEDILKLSGYEGGIEGLKSGDVSLEELQEGGLTEEGLAKLQEYIDGLAEENEALRAMRENAWAQVSDEFDEYIEKMDDGIEKIEHLKSITQSYQNIVDIVGKKYLGVSNDLVDKMNKSMVSQSQDLLKANKAKLEATQASYDQLMNEDTSGWSDQALKERQQLLDKMKDELQSAKEAFMSSWEEALQASADRYAAAVDNIIEEFSDKIAGLYGSLSELQEAYDRASDLDSQYLEDYEQIYQLSKLTRDINNSIDDTDNIAAKEEYRDLLEEINQIEADGTKLSEYDLEVLQKKFELKQAQIALEEAQNAKSSVGMVRGEDGNYSYVYTANDDDVANAEQNYEDKLHEMQVLNGDYINNLQEQIIQTQQECADALAAIKESDFNSYEEWREAVDRTQAYYDQKMDFYYSQLDGALGNNRELYENDWQRYHDLTGYKISDDENYVDKFEETNYSILTGYTTLEEAHSAWTVATGEMLTDLANAYNEWQIDVETAMGLAGTSVDGFAEQMEQDTDRNVQDSQEAAEAVVDMGQQMEETFSETLSAIANWEAEWGSAIDDAIAKNLELIQSFNDMKREMADAMDAVSSYNPGGGSGSGSGSGGGGSNSGGDSGGSGSGGGVNNADKVEGVAAAIWMDGGSTSGWYNGSDRQSRLKEKGVTGAQAYINAHGPNGDIYATWNKKRNQLKSFYYGSFDTGGYTGDWGDKSGRLALLHSKEIVLNAKDTENFLQAIDMVREISGRIDLNAKYATAMMDMMQPTIGRGGAPEIVQNIEINADFPDATDHSEIEMAFNNLINTASQYANRVR